MNGKWESTQGWIFMPLESLRVLLLVSMGSKVIHQLGSVVTPAANWKISLFADWESAIRVGVLDCGEEGNYETCKEYGIHYYPTLRVSAEHPALGKCFLVVKLCHSLFCSWSFCFAEKTAELIKINLRGFCWMQELMQLFWAVIQFWIWKILIERRYHSVKYRVITCI